MDILVIGSGGREHAIIKKIKQSPLVQKIFCCPGNGGIASDAVCVDIKATDIESVVSFSKNNKIDLVVVAPDDPLVMGMVDVLESNGITAFGPNKAAAIIEGSKVFSKELMRKYDIPTAKYESFSNVADAVSYINEMDGEKVVVKADGLALGKGVIVAENHDDAIKAVKSMIEDKSFGNSGSTIVIEEFLEGVEVSVLCFTDSHTIIPMVSAMDHKRAFDGDKGLNTGGMGTIAPHPLFTEQVQKEANELIFIPTVDAMNKEGRPFKGCLYFGLMLTNKGPYVIEYNCRFGDPETQVILPLLESDLVEIMLAVSQEHLSQAKVEWSDKSAACLIMASGGYPEAYNKGYIINGLDKIENATIYHAGTVLKDDRIVTSGGRVLGITSVGNDLKTALDRCYRAADNIHFENCFYRKDIGQKLLF